MKITYVLNKYYEELSKNGYNIYALALKGSQNYNLDDENSDIDAIAVVLPTMSELVENLIIKEKFIFSTGEVEVHDIRNFEQIVRKGNPNFIEIIHSRYILGDLSIFKNQQINSKALIGLMKAKEKALLKTNNTFSQELGYNPKELLHTFRLAEMYDRLEAGEQVSRKLFLTSKRDVLYPIKVGAIPLEKALHLNKVVEYYEKRKTIIDVVNEDLKEKVNQIICENILRKKQVIEYAYAKVNLVLNVLGKRSDGYHEVDFIMNSLDLYDIVSIEESKFDSVIVDGMPHLSNESNLAFKALKLLKMRYKLTKNYLIKISKKIPIAAGLAGGSADAAAVIRGINRIENLGLTVAEQIKFAANLGSDVPFCIYNKLARATGRGEIISPLSQKLPEATILVINPGIELPTKDVFQNYRVNGKHGSHESFKNAQTFAEFTTALHNDLVRSAFGICPELVELNKYLERHNFKNRLMSGSGATMLVFFETYREALIAKETISQKYPQITICQMREN
ncbi:MAG: 4-(cytidine 5'-diphospho)-2-C-methyl-D-erythritol kinase [Mycoplasmatales bacterium]